MLEEIQDKTAEITTPDKIKKNWRAKIESKTFEPSDLINYFQLSAPYFLTVTRKDNVNDNNSCSFDEDGAKAAIIDIVQEIILGARWEEVLGKLKAGNKVSSVCGNIFKNGEPTYSCRECSMDPTCVLCASCFKKSTHRTHKYRMSTSHGGGCCDCGDPEAWKKDYCCDDHAAVEKPDNDAIITDEMKSICQVVFRAILAYCVNMLQIDSDASYPDIDSSETNPLEDVFCTLLYNDETHTFDQVISTLTSVVKCDQREAVEYVTSIDRDGREIVKCSTFNACVKLKNDIEKKGMRSIASSKIQPLRVAIFHKNTVACQTFALQMLHWFQEFLSYSEKFRSVFCNIILTASSSTNYSLRQLLLYDIKLWKVARSAWHRLLISAMLMEYENKKELAINFTKVYTNIMQDFLRDDHYHSFSVVSLSVQLFTVPTVAHHLMAHESAFFKLMHTYYSECIEKYIKNKTLVFPKNSASNFNKRAHFIITDLRYLLTFKPENWTQELRLGFLHGIQIVIRLLKSMQGMDAVTRQVGQHMEYEPEWESAFTLHIKLSSVITAIIDWCSTDKVILVKVYRMVLSALNENKFIVSNIQSKEVKELCDHAVNCLMYDVSSKPVSIHLPLTRFLAGLYIHFEKFNLTFDNVSTTNEKPTLEEIIEPVLCTRTMISQVYSGMWRRNGYSLLNQLFFYRNVKCRTEMLDRDIVILQMGASLIESNEFIIHILNKFNLLSWTEESFKPVLTNSEEDAIRQIVNMVDEFLELLIVIVGERYMEGVGKITEEERVKKEIIQQLCIKPLSHSELNKALNDEHMQGRESDIEPVITEIADFKKSQDKKGVYTLKDDFYSDFNMYFYHYTKEEKSKSEEVMRQRRKLQNELICCPPPKLPLLCSPFTMITNLLQCDSMLHIMLNVFKQALDLNCQTFSEAHLQKILHLIGYAINEEDSGNYPFLTFMERSARLNMLSLMEELVSSPRIESQRDFLIYTIKKYKDQQAKNNTQEPVAEDAQMPSSSYENDTQTETEQAMKERRAKLAALRREQLMAQMAKAQKSFITSHAEHFKDDDDDKVEEDASMDWQATVEERKTNCIGRDRMMVHNEAETFTCILCSEESPCNRDCMVYPAFIQRSSVLSRYQTTTDDTNQLSSIETAIHASPYVSSCGHEMHVNCWKEYFNNEMLKEQRRPFRTRNPSIFNIDKNQFLCPLCRFLSNTVLPIIPPLNSLGEVKAESFETIFNFDKWHTLMSNYIDSLQFLKPNDPDSFDETEQQTEELMKNYKECVVGFLKTNFNFDETQISEALNLNPDICDYTLKFVKNVKDIVPQSIDESDNDVDSFTVAWQTCAYTIQSLEMYMRAIDKPLKGEMSVRYEKCVSGLVRLCGTYGRFENNPAREIQMLPISYKSLLIYARDLFDNLFGRKPDSSILHWDVFSMMTSMLFTTRALIFPLNSQYQIPRGDSLDFTIFNTMFAVNLMKILVTAKVNCDTYMDSDEEISDNEEAVKISSIYESFNIYRTTNTDPTSNRNISSQLIQTLKDQSRTFLRCSCILFHFLTQVPLPDEMAMDDSFEVMAEYLNIDVNITNYFKDSSMLNFMIQCAQHKAVEVYYNRLKADEQNLIPIVPALAPIRQLVSLPDDYSDLINSVSTFTCKNNEREDSRNPTMCLVCGEVICSQTYCCQRELNKQQVGACNYHTEVCGAGAGIYLRIRDAEILLLGQSTGCFLSAPYLDDYGETDQGLRRGHPLHLDRESYKKLQLLWLGHGVHEDIARKTEAQSHIFQIQWTHL